MKTLSDKGVWNTDVGGPCLGAVYWDFDVKQFIEDLKSNFTDEDGILYPKYVIVERINKLAGAELVNWKEEKWKIYIEN